MAKRIINGPLALLPLLALQCLHSSPPPEAPEATTLDLGFSAIKMFELRWDEAEGADYYQLLESSAPGEPFVVIHDDILDLALSISMPLHLRHEASYIVRSCNDTGCTDSEPVSVVGSLAEAIGYFKASNTGGEDFFGYTVALSADGGTLAVGAPWEGSGATGIGGNQADDSAPYAGAVYVFTRSSGSWSQQAYVKASNTDVEDFFGYSVTLSADGNTLAVGALLESSNATGIDGDQADDSASYAGAVYVFARSLGSWSQQAYVKASNPEGGDFFGNSVTLSADGNTLAVGAPWEDSGSTGIGADQGSNSADSAGAVYVFARNPSGQWSQRAYVKASNTGEGDNFGNSVTLSADGNTLAVGAPGEHSSATGIGGDQADDLAPGAGAAYVFLRDTTGTWSQQAYIKASSTDAGDVFGYGVTLSADGNTLAVGAPYEDSSATGIDGDQADDSATHSGAVYVFSRDSIGLWAQQAYVKASNTDEEDSFGASVALSGNGNILAVGVPNEDSSATGIGGNQADDSMPSAGAAHVFTRSSGSWSQRAYAKAPNTDGDDYFGYSVTLSADGNTLAVGARDEESSATGIGGDQGNLSFDAGAVYLY